MKKINLFKVIMLSSALLITAPALGNHTSVYTVKCVREVHKNLSMSIESAYQVCSVDSEAFQGCVKNHQEAAKKRTHSSKELEQSGLEAIRECNSKGSHS